MIWVMRGTALLLFHFFVACFVQQIKLCILKEHLLLSHDIKVAIKMNEIE